MIRNVRRAVILALAVLTSAPSALVWAQTGDGVPPTGEWVQPYRELPGYWELVGRLFADTPEVRRDRRFNGFVDPAVLVAGTIRTAAKPEETLATFVRFLPVQAENVLNADLPPDRLVTAEVTQVRFTAAEAGGVRLDIRTGTPSSEFQQCVDTRHTKFGHLADVRVQSVMFCERTLFWMPWRPQPPIPLDGASRGTLPLEHIGVLALTYDATGKTVRAIVRVP